jgi:hypothetical protein
VQGIAFAVDLEREVRLGLAIRADADRLPPAARRFFATASRPSALWDRFPEHALVALAAQVDVAAMFEMVSDFLSAADRLALRGYLERTVGAVVGKDLFKEVLPSLGPDVGLCLTAPPSAAEGWFPHTILAAAVGKGGNKSAPVDEALLSAVDFYIQLGVMAYNRQHSDQMILKTELENQSRVRSLVNEEHFPPGLQPAFGLQRGFLVLANTAEVLLRFGAVPARNREERSPSEVPLLRVSFKEWRRFLSERYEPVVDYLAERTHSTRSDVAQRLNSLLAVLRLVDQIEVGQQPRPGQLRLVIRVGFSHALK